MTSVVVYYIVVLLMAAVVILSIPAFIKEVKWKDGPLTPIPFWGTIKCVPWAILGFPGMAIGRWFRFMRDEFSQKD